MSNFTPLVERTYEFDGDTVAISFSRLNRKDMMNVLPVFQELKDAEEGKAEHTEGINNVLNALADLIPTYVKKISGLFDSDGAEISIETIVNEMYFMKLSSMIAMDLIKESGVPEGEV